MLLTLKSSQIGQPSNRSFLALPPFKITALSRAHVAQAFKALGSQAKDGMRTNKLLREELALQEVGELRWRPSRRTFLVVVNVDGKSPSSRTEETFQPLQAQYHPAIRGFHRSRRIVSRCRRPERRRLSGRLIQCVLVVQGLSTSCC